MIPALLRYRAHASYNSCLTCVYIRWMYLVSRILSAGRFNELLAFVFSPLNCKLNTGSLVIEVQTPIQVYTHHVNGMVLFAIFSQKPVQLHLERRDEPVGSKSKLAMAFFSFLLDLILHRRGRLAPACMLQDGLFVREPRPIPACISTQRHSSSYKCFLRSHMESNDYSEGRLKPGGAAAPTSCI